MFRDFTQMPKLRCQSLEVDPQLPDSVSRILDTFGIYRVDQPALQNILTEIIHLIEMIKQRIEPFASLLCRRTLQIFNPVFNDITHEFIIARNDENSSEQ